MIGLLMFFAAGNCDAAVADVTARMAVPAPYAIECSTENRADVGGLTYRDVPDEYLSDPQYEDYHDATIIIYRSGATRYVVAHEVCHAYRFSQLTDDEFAEWRAMRRVEAGPLAEELWADACAAAFGLHEAPLSNNAEVQFMRRQLGEYAPPVPHRVRLFQLKHLR